MDSSTDLLMHESPVGLDIRPVIVIRHIPGVALRAPTRAVILIGVGLLIWCMALMVGAPWDASAVGVGMPFAVITWLAEGRVRGRFPLVWALAVVHHHTRPFHLGRRSGR